MNEKHTEEDGDVGAEVAGVAPPPAWLPMPAGTRIADDQGLGVAVVAVRLPEDGCGELLDGDGGVWPWADGNPIETVVSVMPAPEGTEVPWFSTHGGRVRLRWLPALTLETTTTRVVARYIPTEGRTCVSEHFTTLSQGNRHQAAARAAWAMHGNPLMDLFGRAIQEPGSTAMGRAGTREGWTTTTNEG